MKLIQLTDIHLTSRTSTICGRDPKKNFLKAIDHALVNHPNAEALFITGDLSDYGDREDYLFLRSHIKQLPIPVHLCIGNHDDRNTFKKVFPTLTDEKGFIQNVIELSAATALTLDTLKENSHAGEFCAQRMSWLKKQLSSIDKKLIIFLHHHPIKTGVPATDSIMLEEADSLLSALQPYKEKITFIFHGHCHMNLSGSIAGIPFFSPRGTNHASWPNFLEPKFLSTSNLNEVYAIIEFEGDSVTVHPVEFGYSGPIKTDGIIDYQVFKDGKTRN